VSILITGCEGFIGAHLAQMLHGNGAEVVGLDVTAGAKRPWPVITGDVTDRSLIDRLFVQHAVTSVVHCGGVSGPHVCNNFPARVFEVNVLGTLNLFEVARVRKLSGRIVFLSSSSVYGQAAEAASCATPVIEGCHCSPANRMAPRRLPARPCCEHTLPRMALMPLHCVFRSSTGREEPLIAASLK